MLPYDMSKLYTTFDNYFENIFASCFKDLLPNIHPFNRQWYFKHSMSNYLMDLIG